MNKSKFSIKKIWKYLRETSVVVIGVAITLSAGYWISNRNEKRDMDLYLNAIKLELEENIRILDITNKSLIQPAVRYSDYLQSHDKKSLTMDSLKYYSMHYGGTIYNLSTITFKTNAFEMFKTSGYMRLVKNKELMFSIWDTYAILADVKQVFDKYSDLKTEEAKKYFFQYSNSPSDEDILKDPPLYDIYINLPIPFVQKSNYVRAMASINETISKFE